jgi:carbon starvation protein
LNALVLVIIALCSFALAYRYYGLYIANKVLELNSSRVTPAVALDDGHDYHKTNRYVLFGHHFAAIAAAGPLIGPVLAAQFGYLPGALWIVIGAVVAGAVHDMVILFASVRHQGKSISLIAEAEIGKRAGTIASFAVLFILILTLAGLSIAVVNAMFQSPWSAFTVFCTIPIALLMGLYMYVFRPGDLRGGSAIGVALLALAILAGPHVVSNPGHIISIHPLQGPDISLHSGLRVHSLCASSLAPPLSQGLPFHIPQDWDDRSAGSGNRPRSP